MRVSAVVVLALVLLVLSPSVAQAGMPMPRLSETASLQFSTLSFFLAVLFLSAGVICGLWNWLRRDFPRMPRLSYFRSLGVVVLWGLLFVIVLTMIAGARELLTPGAWEQHGFLSKLPDKYEVDSREQGSDATDNYLEQRRGKMGQIKDALWNYAARHEGGFPASLDQSSDDETLWEPPGAFGMRYSYVGDRNVSDESLVLAYEPAVYDDARFVLLTDGSITRYPSDQLIQRLRKEQNP